MKLKLKSNRKGAGLLGGMRTRHCREATNFTGEDLGPKRALAPTNLEKRPTEGVFLFGHTETERSLGMPQRGPRFRL
jgi:hypothetical protein